MACVRNLVGDLVAALSPVSAAEMDHNHLGLILGRVPVHKEIRLDNQYLAHRVWVCRDFWVASTGCRDSRDS